MTRDKLNKALQSLSLRGLPRGKYLGKYLDKPVASEAEHFVRCPCGGWVDRRDLAAVLDHVGPLPHASGDQPQ